MKMLLNEFLELNLSDLIVINGGASGSYSGSGSTKPDHYSAETGWESGWGPSGYTGSTKPDHYSAETGWDPGWGPEGYTGTPTAGTCSGSTKSDPVPSAPTPTPTTPTPEPIDPMPAASPEGVWGGISDSDARDIRMQDEKNLETDEMNGNNADGSTNLLSKKGCKMAGAAQILSQVSGTDVGVKDVNDTYDVNKDGLLTQNEISNALTNAVGENVTVSTDYWEKQLSMENIQESLAKSGTHYVLARAENVVGGDHWIVLEGSFTNNQGQTEFQYNPTSTNDTGRRFILGSVQDGQTNVYTISKVEIYTVN